VPAATEATAIGTTATGATATGATATGATATGVTAAGTEATVSRRTAVITLVTLKVLVQPLVAYLFGRYGLGLAGRPLLAAVVTSGLPTAQNVFVFATRYQRGMTLARDSVVVSTLLAAVSLSLFAYWLV
jgi:predicted permease